MKRQVGVTIAIAAACILGGGAYLAVRGGATGGPVYTVAQVWAGLARHPQLWVGRTVLVRGDARVTLAPGSISSGTAILRDSRDPRASIALSWTALNPVLSATLRVPWLHGLVAGNLGGDGVYRVRLVRRSFLTQAGNLPHYYPYSKKTVHVHEDEAVLLDDLK